MRTRPKVCTLEDASEVSVTLPKLPMRVHLESVMPTTTSRTLLPKCSHSLCNSIAQQHLSEISPLRLLPKHRSDTYQRGEQETHFSWTDDTMTTTPLYHQTTRNHREVAMLRTFQHLHPIATTQAYRWKRHLQRRV